MSDLRPDHVGCRAPAEVVARGEPFLAGYERQLNAAINFFQFIVVNDTPWAMMAFGWPGTGKSTFPSALAYRLNAAGIECGIAYIRCHALTARLSVDEVKQRLDVLDDFVEKCRYPKLIVFDELDALAAGRSEDPAVLRLSTWAMDFFDLEDEAADKSMIIGVTNNPGQIEAAVRDRLPCSVYFEMPGQGVIGSILQHRGIPTPAKVAGMLWERLAGDSLRATGRGAFRAAGLATAAFGDRLRETDAGQIADFMHPHCSSVQEERVSEYEHEHRGLISKSDKFVAAWAQLGEAGRSGAPALTVETRTAEASGASAAAPETQAAVENVRN